MTDPLLAEIDAYRTQQRDRQARTSLLVAGSVPPVRAAQAERDAQVLGIPSQSVLADPRFSREAQVERDATLLASAPKTATWITDDNNAAVAHDQVGSLTRLEGLLQSTRQIGKNLRGSLWANIPQTSAGIVGSVGALSDISDAVLGAPFRAVESLLGTSTYSDNIAAERGRRDGYRQYLMQASAASTPQVDNVYEQAAYSGISSILPSLAGVGVGIATRSPAAGAAFMAVPVGGASYGQARDQGQGVVPSLAYGTAQGGAEFVGEKIGLGPLLDGLKMGSPFLKTFFKTQVAEQLGEQATTVLQDFTDYAMMNEGQTFGDYLRERPNAAVQTAIATAVGSGATTSLSYGAQAGARRLDAYAQERLLAAEAPAKAAHFDEVVEAVKTQELLVRSPERFKTFLNDVTGGNAVYVSGEAAATFFQSNPELDQWLDEWDIRDQVEQAAIAGTDVAIPADVYLSQVAQTQAHEAWHDDLKFEPNGMTLRTAMEREASGEQDLIDAFVEAANDVDQQLNAIEPYERVRSDVFDKLTRAGRPPAEARLGAIILAERYTTRSERMSEQYPDAWSAYQAQGGVEFRREATPSVQRTADRLDLVLKVVQEGDGQTQRQLRGDSLLEFISKSGGVIDTGGDLAALDVAAWSNPRVSGVPGRKRIIRRPDAEPGAYGLDDALTRAKEAGYLREDATVEDLTEAMRGELSGRPTYSADVVRNNRVDETLQAAADLEEMLTTAGIDPSTATIEQVRALVDQAGDVDGGYNQDTPLTGPRGQINPSDADASIITFFRAADASTFIHEMVGHQFLEELMTDAALDGASEQLRADVATVGEWFANYGGAKALDEVRGAAEAAAKRAAKKPDDAALARQVQRLNDALAYAEAQGGADFMVEVGRTLGANVPVAHRSVLMTPYHEVFARGAERYLMEGKSPSVELRGAFARFADWIKKLYKAVDNLNAPISKPVREVMSRLLATDAQIDAVRQAQGLNRIFADPKAGGMNKPEYDAYTKKDQAALEAARARAYEKAMAPIRRQLMETMKAEREELRAEQTAAVDAQPDIAALALIADSGVKLNRQGLIDLAGSDAILKLLPNKRPAIYAKDGGLYPDDLAQRVGLTSGDQLLDALVAHEKERQARVAQGDRRPIRDARIEDALDAMMNFLHGDPVNDGTLDELVTAAMHDKQKAEVLVEEANSLANLAKREALWTREGITAYAKETIDGMVAAKLRPDAYLRAERSAGLKVQRALLKGDYSAALDAKLLQAVNFELYRQSREAGEAFAKGEALFSKIVRAKDDKTAKARNFDMVNAAREILSAYGLTRSRGQTPASYLAAVQAYDADAYAELKPVLDGAVENAAPLDTLTVGQVSELIETIEQLWSLSRQTQVMEIDGRRIELATARQEIAGDLSAQGPRPSKPKNRALTKKERVGTDLLSVRSLLGKVEEWAMRQGPAFTKYIWNPISEGAEAYRTLQREKMPKLQKALETLRPDIAKPFKIEGTEIGYTFGFDGGNGIVELIGAMRHLGNPSNYRKLLLGREWATLNEDGTLNDSAFRAMMDRLHREGVIQKRHWDYVQAEWDLHDEIKPFVQKAHRKMTGRYFEEVTSAPVETPFGTYKGGYVPAKADPNLVKRQREFDAQAQAEGGVRGQALMFPDGSTKARTDVNRALDLDLRKALSQFDETMRYAMIGPAVQDVSRLLKETQFAELLNDYDDGVWNDFLQPWLVRSLAQRTTTPSSHPGIRMAENAMSVVVRRTGASIMFANVVNAAQQLTGFSPALLRTGKRNMAGALRTYLTDPVGTYERVAELSPMMANRFSTQVRDVAMEAERIVMAPGPYGKAVQWSEANTYFLQRGVQNFMDPIVWTAAYDRAVQRKEENPVAYADMVVRTTQDSYAPEGASAFSGGPKWAAPFKMFTGYFIGQANLIATEGKRAWQENDIARMAEIYAMAVFIPAVGAEIISQAIRGTLGDEDEDGWVDDLMDIFLISQLRYVAAFIPILGPGVMSAFNAFDDNPMNDKLSLSPAVSTVEAPARVIANLRKYADGKGDASRMVKDVGTLVSAGTGLPTLPRQTSYVADVLEGDVNPTGPVDAARGFVSGAASEASKEN